jgi:hypothetical protein
MDAKTPSHHPFCLHCKVPMVPHSQEIVDGDTMQIFRCKHCGTLEAVKINKAPTLE